jgi:dolichyldiphosphatase
MADADGWSAARRFKEFIGSAPDEPLLKIDTRWIVVSAVVVTVLWRRDVAAVLCVSGAVLNALLSKVLKRVINEARPAGARLSDPGMPSSHAQSLFFFAAYLSAAVLRAEFLPALVIAESELPSFVQVSSTPEQATVCIALALLSAVGATSRRISDGLHTREQVVVGAIIGGLMGASWCVLVQPRLAAAVATTGGASQAALATSLIVVVTIGLAIAERGIGAALKRRAR